MRKERLPSIGGTERILPIALQETILAEHPSIRDINHFAAPTGLSTTWRESGGKKNGVNDEYDRRQICFVRRPEGERFGQQPIFGSLLEYRFSITCRKS